MKNRKVPTPKNNIRFWSWPEDKFVVHVPTYEKEWTSFAEKAGSLLSWVALTPAYGYWRSYVFKRGVDGDVWRALKNHATELDG